MHGLASRPEELPSPSVGSKLLHRAPRPRHQGRPVRGGGHPRQCIEGDVEPGHVHQSEGQLAVRRSESFGGQRSHCPGLCLGSDQDIGLPYRAAVSKDDAAPITEHLHLVKLRVGLTEKLRNGDR